MDNIEVNTWKPLIPIMNRADIIRLQFMVYCHMEKIRVSYADLDCLTLLMQKGKMEHIPFCDLLAKYNIFGSRQSGRNAIMRLQDKGLILKEEKPKRVSVHPSVTIQSTGNILVDIKCFSPVPKKETVEQ